MKYLYRRQYRSLNAIRREKLDQHAAEMRAKSTHLPLRELRKAAWARRKARMAAAAV